MRYFLTLLLVVLALPFSEAQAEKRVALVIGNAGYQNTTALSTPSNDAVDIAAALPRRRLLVALAEVADDAALLLHLPLAAEDAEVLVHRLGELVADLPGTLAVLSVEQRLQLTLGVRLDSPVTMDSSVRVSAQSAASAAGALAVRDRLHQCVAAETVGAVHRDACVTRRP